MRATDSDTAQKSQKIDDGNGSPQQAQDTFSSSLGNKANQTVDAANAKRSGKSTPKGLNKQESQTTPFKSLSKDRGNVDTQQSQAHMGYDLLGVDGVEDLIEDSSKNGSAANKSRIAHKKLTNIFEEEENQNGHASAVFNDNEGETANLNVDADKEDANEDEEEQFDPGSGLRVEDEDTSEDEQTNARSDKKEVDENGSDDKIDPAKFAAKLPMHLLRLDDLEEPLPLSATRQYPDEKDQLRDKFKQFKRREEERKKHAAEEYQRKHQAMIAAGQAVDEATLESNGEGGHVRKATGDGEDVNGQEEPFTATDLQEVCDGWDLYRKKRGNTMVRRYCTMLDQDYMKHKITVCAYLNHIFDLYTCQRRPFMRTHAGQVERTRLASAHHKHQQLAQQSTNGEPASAGLSNKNYFNGNHYFNNVGTGGPSRSMGPRVNGMRSFKGSGSSFSAVMNAGGQAYYEVKKLREQLSGDPSPLQTREPIDEADEKREQLLQKQLQLFRSGRLGVMDPKISNQVQQSLAYYRQQCPGVFYQNLREENAQNNAGPFTDYTRSNDNYTVTQKPVKRVYLNFDKDLAHRMFGYRVRFSEENMLFNDSKGMPEPYTSQTHKPVYFYAKDRVAPLLARYPRMQGFHSKQTIVRVLDSDNEEDSKEIEKNKKQIKANKQNGNSSFMGGNPKYKKKQRILPWHFDEERPDSASDSPTKNAARRLRQGFGSQQKRIVGQHHTMRYSNKKTEAAESKSATMPAQFQNNLSENHGPSQTETTQETAATTGTSTCGTTVSGRTTQQLPNAAAAIGNHLANQVSSEGIITQPPPAPTAEQALLNIMNQSSAQSQQELLSLAQQPNPTPQSLAYLNQQIMLHYIAQQQQLQAVKNQILSSNSSKKHLLLASQHPTPNNNALRTPQKLIGKNRTLAQSASKPSQGTLLSSQILSSQVSSAFPKSKHDQFVELALAAEAAQSSGGLANLERLTNHFMNWQLQQAENARSAQTSKMMQLNKASQKGLRPQSGLKPSRPAFEARQASVVNPISNAQLAALVEKDGAVQDMANLLVSRQHHSLLNMATKMQQTVPNGHVQQAPGFVLQEPNSGHSIGQYDYSQSGQRQRPSSKRRPMSKRKKSGHQGSQRTSQAGAQINEAKRQDILSSYVPLVGNQQDLRQMTAATANGHNSVTNAMRLDSMSSLGASASSAQKVQSHPQRIMQNPSSRGLVGSQNQSRKSIKVLRKGTYPESGQSDTRDKSRLNDEIEIASDTSPYPQFVGHNQQPYSASKSHAAGGLPGRPHPTTLTSGSYAVPGQHQYKPVFSQPFQLSTGPGPRRPFLNTNHEQHETTSDYVPAVGLPTAPSGDCSKSDHVPRFLGSAAMLTQSQHAVDVSQMMARHSQVVGPAGLQMLDQGSPTKIPASMVHLQHNRTGALASLQSKSAVPVSAEHDKKLIASQFAVGKFSPGLHMQQHRALIPSKEVNGPRVIAKTFDLSNEGPTIRTTAVNLVKMPGQQFASETKRQSMFACYQKEQVNDFRAVVGSKDQMGRHAHSVEKPKDLVISTHQSAGANNGTNVAHMNGSTTTTTTTSGVPQAPSNESSQCYVARAAKPFDLTANNHDQNLKYDKKLYSSYHHGPANKLTANQDSCSKQRQSIGGQLLKIPLDSAC